VVRVLSRGAHENVFRHYADHCLIPIRRLEAHITQTQQTYVELRGRADGTHRYAGQVENEAGIAKSLPLRVTGEFGEGWSCTPRGTNRQRWGSTTIRLRLPVNDSLGTSDSPFSAYLLWTVKSMPRKEKSGEDSGTGYDESQWQGYLGQMVSAEKQTNF
jgi:hypothetical protein